MIVVSQYRGQVLIDLFELNYNDTVILYQP